MHGVTIDSLFSRLETNMRRKRESIEEKKFVLVAKVFRTHTYSTDLIRHIRRTSVL